MLKRSRLCWGVIIPMTMPMLMARGCDLHHSSCFTEPCNNKIFISVIINYFSFRLNLIFVSPLERQMLPFFIFLARASYWILTKVLPMWKQIVKCLQNSQLGTAQQWTAETLQWPSRYCTIIAHFGFLS